MKRFAAALFLVAAVVGAPMALARGLVPLVDRSNVAVVTGSGKPASNEAVKQAIMSAGPRGWSIVPTGDGRTLKATYSIRKHTVVVDIVAGSKSYSVKYADSTNMHYSADRGSPLIHPNYNQWVDQLIQAIGGELRKL
jgi:hypothetical protein